VWFGDYSALYLELGPLTQRIRKDGTPGNPEGQFTIYAGHCWRIEKVQSILGGSSCSSAKRKSLINQLSGAAVASATITGRIPELQLCFSNDIWLVTFSPSKGQPDWSVSFRGGATVHLCVQGGELAVDRRDY
jgi:hypothetical protein